MSSRVQLTQLAAPRMSPRKSPRGRERGRAGLQIRGSKFQSLNSNSRELELTNLLGLVLGRIEAKFCKWILVGKLSPRSTQCTPLHRSLISIFSLKIAVLQSGMASTRRLTSIPKTNNNESALNHHHEDITRSKIPKPEAWGKRSVNYTRKEGSSTLNNPSDYR